MPETKFPLWDLRSLIGDYLSRQIDTDDGRLSPLMSLLIVASISIALWAVVAIFAVRFV